MRQSITDNFPKILFRFSRRQHIRFYKKLASLLRMERPLPEALEMIWKNVSEDGKNPKRPAAVAMKVWRQNLERGRLISEAMQGWVPDRDLLLLKAGEASGHMESGLMTILSMEGILNDMKKALTGAVSYPTFLLVGFVGLLLGIDAQLIGPFQKMSPQLVEKSTLSDLAALTSFLKSNGILLGAVAGPCLGLVIYSLKAWTGKFRSYFDAVPPWSWYRLWQGTGAMLALASLLRVQTTAREAFEILEDKSSPWLQEKLKTARLHMLRGKNFGEALKGDGLDFPDKELAMDLQIFSMRGDIGAYLDQLTREWVRFQVEKLEQQAIIARTVGLMLIGVLIAWVFSAIMSIGQTIDALGTKAI